MAVNPENYFTGDGSTTSFVFTFEYIDETDVKVSVDGAVQATTAYSFANATTILFDTAPAADTEVRIYRDTNVDELKSTFFAGSSIRAQDLNQNFEQNNFAVQEIKAYTWDNETQTIHSDETWVSSDAQIATTAAMDQRFQDEANDTLTKAELAALSDVIPDNDDAVPTTGAVKDYVDHVIETDILVDGTGLNKTGSSGQVTIGISAGSVDLDRIKPADIVDSTETWSATDTQVATTQAIEDRIDEIITNDIGTDGTGITVTDDGDGTITLGLANNSIDLARIKNADIITSGESDPDNDITIATTAKIGDMIDVAIANDITSDGSGVTVTDDGDGTITLSVEEGALNLNRINAGNIVTESEQDGGAAENDTTIFTTLAAAKRFDTLVQTANPGLTGNWETGKTWLQNDDDLTLSVWNGTGWVAITSGGTFTSQPNVVYVDKASGDDNNNGHRISTPKASITSAIDQINGEISLSTDTDEGFNGGSGYVDAVYSNVSLTHSSGTGIGTGLTASITVTSGAVTAITLSAAQQTALEEYSIGDVLTASNADLGGSGSGLLIPITGAGDGQIVVVSAGVYREAAPIQIKRRNVSIIGQALRSCLVHPTTATENNVLFELNSGSYISNLTLTGVQAGTGTGNTLDADLPTDQGWNFGFYDGAFIVKSPYIQNCTNFSDSEIDNDALNAHNPDGGAASDTDSAPTGGGMLVNGAAVADDSPLRSMVADSYTHVGLNGPGVLVVNNGYAQITSSYAFFNKYHIKCLSGGQANLAASTTDFGDQALVADGRSTNAIFTSTTIADAADEATEFFIEGPTERTATPLPWHGSSTRPQSNMLVDIGGNTYPILSASNTFASTEIVSGRDYTILTVGDTDFTAIGAASNTVGVQFTATGVGTGSGTVTDDTGWRVTISRPDPNNRNNNLGLNGAVTSGGAVSFFLRSQVASSGHTMEYVGSGTDYRALPENGGVPDETKQITESNNGKVWTAITDHNGKFKIGGNQTTDPIFEVDQQTGFITIPEGSIAFNLLSDTTPQLGGNLDVNGNTITGLSNPTANDEVANKAYVDSVAGTPTQIAQLNTSVATSDTGTDGTITVTADGSTLVTGTNNNLEITGAPPTVEIKRSTTASTGNNFGSIEFHNSNNDVLGSIRGFSENANTQLGLQFSTGADSTALTIDENGRLLVGTTEVTSSTHAKIQAASTGGAFLVLARNDTSVSDNNIGVIQFFGNDDDGNYEECAQIACIADGTHATGDKPSSLSFQTTADSAASPTERMSIDSSGRVKIGNDTDYSAASGSKLAVELMTTAGTILEIADQTSGFSTFESVKNAGGGATDYGGYIFSGRRDADDDIKEYLRINASGNVGIGATNPSQLLHLSSSGPRILLTQTADNSNAFLDAATSGVLEFSADDNNVATNSSIRFKVDGGEKVRIDSSGRLLVGTSTARTNAPGGTEGFLVEGTSSTNSQNRFIQQVFGSSGADGPYLGLAKTRSTSIGGNTVVQSGDELGGIYFQGADGSNLKQGASILSYVDGTPGTNDMPGRLSFATTADGASSPTERLRIASTGAFGIAGANYGTSGQVLTSQGSSAAPQWATPAGGKILQVVQTIKTDTDSSTSTTFVDISGLSATITPSSTSSKILVFVGIGCASSQYDERGVLYRILRGSTPIGQGDNAQTGPCGWGQMSYSTYVNGSHSPVILDSPSTTSATTYKVQWHISAGMTFYLNRTYSGTSGLFQRRAASTITLMEVQG